LEEIGERPAVKQAMALGPEFRENPASISADEQARRQQVVGTQQAPAVAEEWIAAATG
jgi:hypothetical protein